MRDLIIVGFSANIIIPFGPILVRMDEALHASHTIIKVGSL